MKQGLPDLQAFVKKYPDGKFSAQAMMMIGQVQAAMGNDAGAIQSSRRLPQSFRIRNSRRRLIFQQAAILGKEGKIDEMGMLMQDFIKSYPDNKDIFYAYDTSGKPR